MAMKYSPQQQGVLLEDGSGSNGSIGRVRNNMHSGDDLSTPENTSFATGYSAQQPSMQTVGVASGASANSSFAEGGQQPPPNLSFETLQWVKRFQETTSQERTEGDGDWMALAKNIRDEVEAGATPPPAHSPLPYRFVEYLPNEQGPFDHRLARNATAPEDPSLVKVFVGNMRFEMGRATIAWTFQQACQVTIPEQRILIHFRPATHGGQQPTGCASVFVPPEDARLLIEVNQRVFCGAKGIFIAPTADAMRQLIAERKVFDKGDNGRLRGPKNSMVVEMSHPRGSSSPSGGQPANSGGASPGNMQHHHSPAQRQASPQQYAVVHQGSPQQQQLTPGQYAPATVLVATTTTPPIIAVPSRTVASPRYYKYDASAQGSQPSGQPPALRNPVEVFVGGICYEAASGFVAWMLSLTGVMVHPGNVTMFKDPKTGNKTGCAIARVETDVLSVLLSYHHRIFCDPCGAFIADSTVSMQAFLAGIKERGDVVRGPTHAVVIERRKSAPGGDPAFGGGRHVHIAGELPPNYTTATVGQGRGATTVWAAHAIPVVPNWSFPNFVAAAGKVAIQAPGALQQRVVPPPSYRQQSTFPLAGGCPTPPIGNNATALTNEGRGIPSARSAPVLCAEIDEHGDANQQSAATIASPQQHTSQSTQDLPHASS